MTSLLKFKYKTNRIENRIQSDLLCSCEIGWISIDLSNVVIGERNVHGRLNHSVEDPMYPEEISELTIVSMDQLNEHNLDILVVQ